MADIRPFRSWRYNEERIHDINRKFSPLFDVVSEEQLQQLYEIPNNSIHLSVPKSLEDALMKLDEWKQNEIIIQDPVPGIYVYYQDFSLYGEQRRFTRKGFISMVRLNEEPDIVLHEKTIESSVNDRIELLEKTMLNVSPTHGLYEDPDFQLEELMDRYMESPAYEYIDYQGVINKLAIVHEKRDLDVFIAAMKRRKIYLADGHHRFASSLTLQEKKKGLEQPNDSMVNYHLMYLTNINSDDLRILPIHRVVKLDNNNESVEDFLARFENQFEWQEVTMHKAPLYDELAKENGKVGMIYQGRQFILQLKENVSRIGDNPEEIPDAVKELDYTVVHYFIFDRILGFPYADQARHDEIVYEKNYYTAVKAADPGTNCASFIINGLGMQEMLSVCETGALMPQKSTYFYPKVLCGLVFASIDDKENDSPLDACFRLAEEKATAD